LQDNYNSLDNLETTFAKSTVTQERVSLVASHMYKQYLQYNSALSFGYQTFLEINKEVEIIADIMKQSFAVRNIPTQHIFVEKDAKDPTVIMFNILWHKISFSVRSNLIPTSLPRENGKPPILSYRIMAVNGNYNELLKNVDKNNTELDILLEQEIASLFIPSEKTQPAIMTFRRLANKELSLSSVDASREFVLKVLETVCGGNIYHKFCDRKQLF